MLMRLAKIYCLVVCMKIDNAEYQSEIPGPFHINWKITHTHQIIFLNQLKHQATYPTQKPTPATAWPKPQEMLESLNYSKFASEVWSHTSSQGFDAKTYRRYSSPYLINSPPPPHQVSQSLLSPSICSKMARKRQYYSLT